MITLDTKVYKYGSFRGLEVLEFNSKDELSEWFLDSKEYSDDVNRESEECGENCGKWSIRFNYMGKDYQHQIDI